MARLMIGLTATIANDECASVRLRRGAEDSGVVYVRDGDGFWAREDMEQEAIHSEELVSVIQQEYSGRGAIVECFLGAEQVTYRVESGGTTVLRKPAEGPSASPLEDLASLGRLLDAFGTPKSRRRAKLQQALQFGKIVAAALAGYQGKRLSILDLACGRSYLGFVLMHQAARRGLRAGLHGVDANPAYVQKSRAVAESLGLADCTFEQADLAGYSGEGGNYDVVVCLHGCDTLTDEAIRIAWESKSRLVFLAPCCQHELRHTWQEHPLQWASRYGLIEQRLADALTDGYRCLVLEALGYQVKVLRFATQSLSPKNLLIQGQLMSGPVQERADAAWRFCQRFGARLRLADVLDAAGFRPPKG